MACLEEDYTQKIFSDLNMVYTLNGFNQVLWCMMMEWKLSASALECMACKLPDYFGFGTGTNEDV